MEECEAVMSIPPIATAAADIGCEHVLPELCCSKIGIAFFHVKPTERESGNSQKNNKCDEEDYNLSVRWGLRLLFRILDSQ